jgi:replicative DNA helicase
MSELQRVEQKLSVAPLRIYDTESQIAGIKSKSKRLKETMGLDVIIVDFIQNVRAGGDEFSDARNVALELQSLAKELSVTVVAFSQVSNEQAKRQFESEDDNYFSFKSSGAIRDAADLALMLRRDRMGGSPYLNCKVLKNRHGEVGQNIVLNMHLETGHIEESDQIAGEDSQ